MDQYTLPHKEGRPGEPESECGLGHQWSESGFITQYLVSGLKETPFQAESRDENQLRYEKYLRSIVTEKRDMRPEGEIKLGEMGSFSLPWRYYYNYGSWFVDLSTFYSVLTKVELSACTVLEVLEDMEVRAAVWSYASLDIWCGEEKVCTMTPPVYKPIRRQEMTLHLKKGRNLLFISLQTLGVRDTRTLFGIQLLERTEDICVTLPDEEKTRPVMESARWMSEIKIRNHRLCFPSPAPEGAVLGYDSMSPDFAKARTKVERQKLSGETEVELSEDRPYVVVEYEIRGQKLSRRMEDIGYIRPKYLKGLDFEANKTEIFRRTASVEALSRGGKFGFSISNILARRALGREEARDRELLFETLSQIESRYDCSDFLVCGLVRYMKNYEMDEELSSRVKDVLLHYRYWMDQEGSDAMCFWSENHSLMFYVSAMNAGELYPEEYFTRAHMTGRELYETGKKRVEQWLDDVEEHGFEEFLSTVYMCVTFAGLLNAVDYTTEELSRRAKKVTDRLLTMLSRHTYKGSVIAPMGRVYRQVIYPFLQGAQALMNLVNPLVPYSYGEGWLAFYATSTYRIPENLCRLMEEELSEEYTTGNALIRLEKNEAYCLTSVQSPRQDEGFVRWENLTLAEDEKRVDKGSHEYTKSLNERFHGTTCFEPGIYGYQQHLWSAALDGETEVFVNHPGGSCDSSEMRPGYWYGNGVMPAISQEKGMLLAIYVIPEDHPIHFTHVFWPECKFEQFIKEGHWLFGQKAQGYIALWCSGELTPYDDQLFQCEYRCMEEKAAYLCICGSSWEHESLEAFMEYAKSRKPSFTQGHNKTHTLRVGAAGKALIYETRTDKTQYI